MYQARAYVPKAKNVLFSVVRSQQNDTGTYTNSLPRYSKGITLYRKKADFGSQTWHFLRLKKKRPYCVTESKLKTFFFSSGT